MMAEEKCFRAADRAKVGFAAVESGMLLDRIGQVFSVAKGLTQFLLKEQQRKELADLELEAALVE